MLSKINLGLHHDWLYSAGYSSSYFPMQGFLLLHDGKVCRVITTVYLRRIWVHECTLPTRECQMAKSVITTRLYMFFFYPYQFLLLIAELLAVTNPYAPLLVSSIFLPFAPRTVTQFFITHCLQPTKFQHHTPRQPVLLSSDRKRHRQLCHGRCMPDDGSTDIIVRC